MIKSLWVGVALFGVTSVVYSQAFEHDYSKYLRPLVFVIPEAPVAIETNPQRKYVAKIDIQANGTVKLPVAIEPDEPLMVAAVNDAARFWLFAPSLTGDCRPGPRSGKINFEYDSPSGRVWVELPKIVANDGKAEFDVIDRDMVSYPEFEARKGIERGKVTISVKLMPDGKVSDASVFTAIPPTKGFIATALRGARSTVVKFKQPIDQPFICTLVTYSFVLE